MRVGIGYDSHRFIAGRPLVLGGVTIPHPLGLAGHSDADVVLHALGDALLGAAALGDIGAFFPDDDTRFKDADSSELLRTIVTQVQAAGYRVGNVDMTILAEQPRVLPYINPMREHLAGLLQTRPADVSIKGKTNEKMGWLGRGEGIACLAVAVLEHLPA
jgi:2-C-methyl-D-erythritol 2,4-cyclodiphosphate synthase